MKLSKQKELLINWRDKISNYSDWRSIYRIVRDSVTISDVIYGDEEDYVKSKSFLELAQDEDYFLFLYLISSDVSALLYSELDYIEDDCDKCLDLKESLIQTINNLLNETNIS